MLQLARWNIYLHGGSNMRCHQAPRSASRAIHQVTTSACTRLRSYHGRNMLGHPQLVGGFEI